MSTACAAKPKVPPVSEIVEPIADRVLIRPDDVEDETPGGIALPETYCKSVSAGTVVAVGPKVEQAKVGDRVRFSPCVSAPALQVQDTKYVHLHEKDLILIWK